MDRRLLRLAASAITLAPLVGCGPDNGLTMGQVRGTVTDRGKPLKYGQVMFVPDETKGTNGPLAMGMITQDGSFELTTETSGDGAVVGHHKVGLVGLDPVPTGAPDPPKDGGGNADVMKSKAKAVTAKVAKGQGDTFTDRGGRVFRYVIPKRLGQAEESGLTAKVEGGSNQFHFDVKEDGSVEVK